MNNIIGHLTSIEFISGLIVFIGILIVFLARKSDRNNKNVVLVDKIQLLSDSKAEVSFKRLSSSELNIDLGKFIQLPVMSSLNKNMAVQSAVSSGIAMASQGGMAMATQAGLMQAFNSNGLFSATVNPILLTKFRDGTFSTMIHGSKGISSHAGYQAASASVFAPLIIFQAMSMVTGQYYFQGITKQLNSINKKIDKLFELHHIERLAKIRNSINIIKKLYTINHPNIEDMLSLKLVENDIGVIHEEYVHQISNIDIESIRSSEKWKISSKIEELYSKVNDASFDFNLNMAITTDEILHLLKIIELILNSKMSDNIDNRSKRIGEILEEVKNWNSNEFYRVRFGDTYVADFYTAVVETAEEIYYKAIIGKEKVKSAIDEFKEKKLQIEENIGGKIHALEMGKKLIEQMNTPVDILYLIDEKQGDRILFRK